MKIIFKYFLKRIILGTAVISLCWGILTAQDISSTSQKTVSSIQLTFIKKTDVGKTALVKVSAIGKDNTRTPAKNIRINFYTQNKKDLAYLNKAITDGEGKASIELPRELPLDTAGYFTIMAKIENDRIFENAEEVIRYKEANITINLNSQDTLKLATVIVTESDSNGNEKPVINSEVKFYVQRTFGIMPAAEENTLNTDDKGQAIFSFPKNIPGDIAGNITIVARIEDDELYGNVENKAVARWGIPLQMEKDPFPRALWEPRAPLTLLVTISVLFGGVWVAFFIIFYQLNKIKNDYNLKVNRSIKF